MTKMLIALVLAASLAACATPQPTPVAATARGNVSGVATLALWGTYEMEVAPVFTRLTVLANQAARQFETGRISRPSAAEIEALAIQARSRIESARRGSQTAPSLVQRAALAEAVRLIERAESLLEH